MQLKVCIIGSDILTCFQGELEVDIKVPHSILPKI